MCVWGGGVSVVVCLWVCGCGCVSVCLCVLVRVCLCGKRQQYKQFKTGDMMVMLRYDFSMLRGKLSVKALSCI